MKLALLGIDRDTPAIARAAAAAGHEIVWMYDDGAGGPLIGSLVPDASRGESWESLLTGSIGDAVIVARSPDTEVRADQLRKLMQEAVPLLVAHPIHDSMLIYYELDMIRRERLGPVLPYLPARSHPAIGTLAGLFEGSDARLGTPEQAVFQRATAARTPNEILDHFARDIDLVRALCGDMTHVAALAPAEGAGRYANLGVQLNGPRGIVVRWSVEPTQATPRGRLTLIGSRGQAVLEMPDASDGHAAASWQVEIASAAGSRSETFPPWDPAAVALTQLARVVAGEEVEPTWVDAARSVELRETIGRSLAKGRTIELYYEDYSEQATFKGTMTSLGCGLLVAALISLGVAAFAARIGVRWAGYWLYILLGLFALFLLLQLFKLVFPREES